MSVVLQPNSSTDQSSKYGHSATQSGYADTDTQTQTGSSRRLAPALFASGFSPIDPMSTSANSGNAQFSGHTGPLWGWAAITAPASSASVPLLSANRLGERRTRQPALGAHQHSKFQYKSAMGYLILGATNHQLVIHRQQIWSVAIATPFVAYRLLPLIRGIIQPPRIAWSQHETRLDQSNHHQSNHRRIHRRLRQSESISAVHFPLPSRNSRCTPALNPNTASL
jgi:hypothetical protein